MTILILHVIGGKAGDHWEQWLHDALTADGHTVIMPSLPNPDRPDRSTWLLEVQGILQDVRDDVVIVGHSLSVPTALDAIEVSSIQIKGLLSVSGFAVPYGLELNEYFMQEKTIDFSKVRKNLQHAAVFYGDDDPYVTQDALQNLATELRVEPRVIKKGGHLNTDAGYTTFPTVLDTISNFT